MAQDEEQETQQSVRRPDDGRLGRGKQTRKHIVEAYILLLHERRQVPTAAQVAERAGYALRTLFTHFPDTIKLSLAACDHAIAQGLAIPVADRAERSRDQRIAFQVEIRARNSEIWLPLWRLLMHYQDRAPQLAGRMKLVRRLIRERLEIMYRPELATLPESERRAMVVTLETILDIEVWGRMREERGLSFEEAWGVWARLVDRLLPPTPLP
jgi:AcrR family transcriptional regulator